MSGPIWGMTQMCCGRCGIEFAVPDSFYEERRKRGPALGWHCPNGHPRVFKESETDELKRERDRLQQQLAQKDDEIAQQRRYREEAERRHIAAKGQITKLRNRVAHGVCPCCNRTFDNLARHMATKHPSFSADAARDQALKGAAT